MPFCWKKNHFLKVILSVIFEHVSVCVCTCLSAVYVYFLRLHFQFIKTQWLGPRHRFHFYIDNFILLISVTIGNTYLADTSYYSPGSFGKRMAVSGSLSSLWKISLNLVFVDSESVSSSYRKDHTSIILYFQYYQTTIWFKLFL